MICDDITIIAPTIPPINAQLVAIRIVTSINYFTHLPIGFNTIFFTKIIFNWFIIELNIHFVLIIKLYYNKPIYFIFIFLTTIG
jgi:hypothetical protein